MIKFSHYEIEKDIYRKGKPIYYLIGMEDSANIGHIIASYSIKLNRIIVRNKFNYIPSEDVLSDFVKISLERDRGGIKYED